MANFGIFTQERPLALKLGILFGEISLVDNLINLAWGAPPGGQFWQLSIWVESPCWLVSATWVHVGNFTQDCPLVANLSKFLRSAPCDKFFLLNQLAKLSNLSVECPWR